LWSLTGRLYKRPRRISLATPGDEDRHSEAVERNALQRLSPAIRWNTSAIADGTKLYLANDNWAQLRFSGQLGRCCAWLVERIAPKRQRS